MVDNHFSFDVALSFAGEDRKYVENVASILREMGFRVFYDKYEKVSLWGKDLYVHLREIYQNRAKYTVMFISKHYADKLWTNHERESAQARAFSESKEYILPARFDKTTIPGITPTIGYVNLKHLNPEELAEMIKEKIGPIRRTEFFPESLDVLFSNLKLKRNKDKEKAEIYAHSFFKSLKLMTPKERNILFVATTHSCPGCLPKKVHIDVEYLERLVSLSHDEIISLFSRLDCLGIESKVKNMKRHDKSSLRNEMEYLEIKFEPNVEPLGGATYIMAGIFDCFVSNVCPGCTDVAINNMDFSVLSTRAGFPETH